MDLVVSPDSEPTRLDRYVSAHVPEVSRRRLRESGAPILLNGRPARRSALVRPGDVIGVPDELVAPPELPAATRLDMAILFEDETLIAVDKPAGLSSVALRAGESRTVAGFLVGLHPELREVGRSPLEGGLVHRLDRETSGVLLAARTPAAYAELRGQFASHAVRKDYLAVVAGDVTTSGWIRTPIAHDPRHRKRMRVCTDASSREQLKARPAGTFYRAEMRCATATLLRVSIDTGVRHQIRVHLASSGHPVLGDTMYGGAAAGLLLGGRHALHASRLELRHPLSGETLVIDSPWPPDLEELMRRLRGASAGGARRRERPRRDASKTPRPPRGRRS